MKIEIEDVKYLIEKLSYIPSGLDKTIFFRIENDPERYNHGGCWFGYYVESSDNVTMYYIDKEKFEKYLQKCKHCLVDCIREANYNIKYTQFTYKDIFI